MNKIIIYHHDMTDLQATYYVMKVIQEGNAQYRHMTRFSNGVRVYADVTRKGGVPTFRVMAALEAKP